MRILRLEETYANKEVVTMQASLKQDQRGIGVEPQLYNRVLEGLARNTLILIRSSSYSRFSTTIFFF